jgi:O-antigen ligase
MIWLLGGYMWLYVHRPFEVWPALGVLQFERGYMLVMLLAWAVTPTKGLAANRIHLALGLFSVVILGSWVLSPYADRPGVWDVVDNFLKVSVFYVLVVTAVRDERGLRLLALLFLGAVALYMAHSLWEFLHGRYVWRMGTRRMIGVDATFSDPNAFASTLLYAIPMTLPFWSERPRRVPRFALIGFVCCCACCILLTGSRAGFTGLCFLGFLLVVLYSKRKLQAVLVSGVVGAVALLALSIALPDDLQNRYLTLVDSSRGPENARLSAGGRLEGFVLGLEIWQRSPLIGYGPASFAYSTERGGQAHNLYGQVMSELGLLGAVALLALVACFWLNWRQTRRLVPQPQPNDFAYHLSRAVGINVVLLLVMGCAGHNLFRYNWQWLAAFSAVAVYCLRKRAELAPALEYDPAPYHAHPALQLEG